MFASRFSRTLLLPLAGWGCAHTQQPQNPDSRVPPSRHTTSASSSSRPQPFKELADRILKAANTIPFASPDHPGCPNLRDASASACELGLEICQAESSKCSRVMTLCRLAVLTSFQRCTHVYAMDARCHRAETCRQIDDAEAGLMPSFHPDVVRQFEYQCSHHDAESCAFLGWLSDRGFAMPRDPDRKLSFLSAACDGGSPTGCYELGMAYYVGRDVSLDSERAVRLFEVACKTDPTKCGALAAAYVDGRGVARSATTADDLFARACLAGATPDCELRRCLQRLVTSEPSTAQLFECAGFRQRRATRTRSPSKLTPLTPLLEE